MKKSLLQEERRAGARHEDNPEEHQADTPVSNTDTTQEESPVNTPDTTQEDSTVNTPDPTQEDSTVNTPGSTQESPQEEAPAVVNSATSFQDAGEACIPDSQGRYGSSQGANTQQIEYGYQLEIKPDVSFQTVTYQIMPEVERRVSGIVVPVMFEQACSRSGTRRRLEVDGFTSYPPDKVITDEKCQVTLRNSENNCYVVVGDATVFSQNELDDEILDRAREFVAKSMNEGMFDQIHEGIVGVSYYGDSTGNDPQSTVTKSTAEDDSLNPAVIWGPIVGAVVLVAAIAALFVRHNRQRNQTPKPLGTDPLGIRPSTRDDYLHREFSQQTRSSWDVLQHSTTPKKEELGISARGLADSPHEFVEIPKSSWDVLQQSSSSQQQIPLQGMPTQFIEDSSRFIDLGGAQQGEQWEDESVLTG